MSPARASSMSMPARLPDATGRGDASGHGDESALPTLTLPATMTASGQQPQQLQHQGACPSGAVSGGYRE